MALQVARSVFRPGARLDGPEWDRCRSRVERLTVWRFRRDVAGEVLSQRGQLSEVERDRLERCPPFRAPRMAPESWRAGVSVALVAAGRGPR
ncbi:hypothetical protein [Actinomadura sp. WAC 06369]|uniref:hypothetical protein n=1 Tax=Actinomadura sp. WAC 06369 TaxID=2203193 RepID=UPI000F7A7DD3|nr:hypothetical protein [Actinomadura sp. WAC 06369]